MPPGRGQPPPAREMPLAPRPPERADRDGILEPHPAAVRQPDTATAAVTGKFQLNAIIADFSNAAPVDPTSPIPSPMITYRANCSETKALTGKIH